MFTLAVHYPRLCKALSEISSGCSSAPAERPAQPAEHCWDRAAAAPPHRGLYPQPYNKAGGLQLFTACDRSPRAPSVPRTSEGHMQALTPTHKHSQRPAPSRIPISLLSCKSPKYTRNSLQPFPECGVSVGHSHESLCRNG